MNAEETRVITEYIQARNAYVEATRAKGFAYAKELPYSSPVVIRYREAKAVFDRLVHIPDTEG